MPLVTSTNAYCFNQLISTKIFLQRLAKLLLMSNKKHIDAYKSLYLDKQVATKWTPTTLIWRVFEPKPGKITCNVILLWKVSTPTLNHHVNLLLLWISNQMQQIQVIPLKISEIYQFHKSCNLIGCNNLEKSQAHLTKIHFKN